MKTTAGSLLLAGAMSTGMASGVFADDTGESKAPQPHMMMCVMGMEYAQKTYSVIPFLGGLSRISIDGTATIACPGREKVNLKLTGSGVAAGLQVPSGANPFVHKGKKISGTFNISVPALMTNRQFEASYFYAGANSPIGGVESSPFLNSQGDTDVVLYMPADLNVSAGASLKTITLKK